MGVKTFPGRKADVHKTLTSASKVQSEGHVAVVDSKGGYIHPFQQLTCKRDSTIRSK